MDTSEHLRVAREAALAWWSSPSPTGETADAVVAALASAGLLREPGSSLCTRAEREFIEASALHFNGSGEPRCWLVALEAMKAERASAPATAPEPVVDLTPGMVADAATRIAVGGMLRLRSPEDRAAYLEQKVHEQLARIASLESALAEERAKPKEGARWLLAAYSYLSGRCEQDGTATRLWVTESREHAAKLTAEQGGSQ